MRHVQRRASLPSCSRLNVDEIDRRQQLHAAEAKTQHAKNEAETHKCISVKTRRGSTNIFQCNMTNQTYFIHPLQRAVTMPQQQPKISTNANRNHICDKVSAKNNI